MIARINDLLRQAWQDNSVSPSASADDYEWVRRIYLTMTGRIPTEQEVAAFVNSPARDKRTELVDLLLTAPDSSANLAATWTNLLIGRSNPRSVNQPALFRFLQQEFSQNRPWIEVVSRLIAAEGRSDQQGETNFLLAHLNDQATPATAVTAQAVSWAAGTLHAVPRSSSGTAAQTKPLLVAQRIFQKHGQWPACLRCLKHSPAGAHAV
jgi:hypothetical protein